MKAVVIIDHTENRTWLTDIAINYTQLNFDYSVTSRIKSNEFEYFITNDVDYNNFKEYEYTIFIPSGVILGFTFYENNLADRIENSNAEFINLKYGVFVYKPNGNGHETIHLRKFPYVDGSSQDSFSATHDKIMQPLIYHSNMSYIIHNEIPTINVKTDPLDLAITVSSGFFINHVLHENGFNENADVVHIDISKMSLQAREYTIENWDGKNFLDWMDHLYEKFPSMELFNRGRFTSSDKTTKDMWANTQAYFGNQWEEHWQQYKKLNHFFYECNLSDSDRLSNLLKRHESKQSKAFWWNGALKRLPANLLKTSEQSHAGAIQFLRTINNFDSSMSCFGSDHCGLQWNGEKAKDILPIIEKQNSRSVLWKKI